MSPSRVQRARFGLALASVVALALGGVAAAEPVLHEFIDLGPGRDPVEPVVTGEYPELTSSAPPGGRPSAPGNGGPPSPPGSAPSNPEPGLTPGVPFSIDRDTTRPSKVSYEDPFTPTVVPFKRGVVYDSVNRDGELTVRDAHLQPVPGAGGPRSSDEHFHAKLELDLRPGVPLSIPSVAPGSRLVMAHPSPEARLSFAVDSAENWFVRSERGGRFELTLQIVADRRVFGSNFDDASWSEVGREMPALPANVKQSALEVARALGVAETARPREAVLHLVEHFRRFRSSSRRPTGYGLALYRELALTARGICRHRSYAFMITALGLGIPTRMALNEAHAWVEVFDGELWHRIDLGGAAEELETADSGRPQHVQPRDPFAWPDQSESGSALAARRSHSSNGPDPSGRPPPAGGAGGASPGGRQPGSGPLAGDFEDDAAVNALTAPGGLDNSPGGLGNPPVGADEPIVISHVALEHGARTAERGKALFVSGRVAASGRSCPGMSVAIELGAKTASVPLGTLISDARGEFAGRLIVPWNATLGEHSLTARALGGCEP